MKALRYIKLLTATALVALSAASSFSCAESEGPSVVILCETEIVVFPYTAFDSRTLSISVNGADSWDVSEKPDWIAAEREGQLLTLTASENESFRERTGQIVISAGSGRKTIPVTQTGNPGALIHLSPESVSFPGESFVPVAVEVVAMESSLEWTVTSVPDWIDCTRTELKLELTAQPNRAYRERRGEVVVSSQGISRHISVVQSGTTPSFIVRQVGNMPAMAVSPNGRYVVGWGGNRSFLYDRGTDQTTPIGSGSGEVDPNDISKGRYLAYDVSDTGLIVGAAFLGGDTMPFSLDIDRGEFTWLTLPGDLEGRAPSSGIAWGVSADGTAISGMVSYPRTDFENTQLQNLPVVWQNGSPTVLGHDPEGLGDGDNTRGYAANNISADGSVVAGYLETRFSDRVGCYWTMSDPEKVNLFLLDDPEFYSTYFN
ncbi:MAG: BACON domain-containing protein, partial [Alistipes sp.]|nr:BACON domain-containing protein [Alistipes sp.]